MRVVFMANLLMFVCKIRAVLCYKLNASHNFEGNLTFEAGVSVRQRLPSVLYRAKGDS